MLPFLQLNQSTTILDIMTKVILLTVSKHGSQCLVIMLWPSMCIYSDMTAQAAIHSSWMLSHKASCAFKVVPTCLTMFQRLQVSESTTVMDITTGVILLNVSNNTSHCIVIILRPLDAHIPVVDICQPSKAHQSAISVVWSTFCIVPKHMLNFLWLGHLPKPMIFLRAGHPGSTGE